MNFKNYFIVVLFAIIVTISFFTDLYNNHLSVSHNINLRSNADSDFLQDSYAFHEEYYKDVNDKVKEVDRNEGSSIFNIAAVGDFDCNGDSEETVENIIHQDPEIVLALGDFSYNGDAECWLKLIEPVANKTKIVFGNHEVDSNKLTEDYLNYFGLKEQYYSFNYKNIHFLALSTETDYNEDSTQYQFAIRDFEKYSKDPQIDWIIVFYHRHMYGSGSLEADTDFREIYHPLFDKYKIDLALQGHLHVYERTYPLTFNHEDNNESLVHNNINNDNISNFYSQGNRTINILTDAFNNNENKNDKSGEGFEENSNYSKSNIYKNPKGPIFVTVGTGGAHYMLLSFLDDYVAKGIDGTFGILDIALQADQNTLTGTFIENGKEKKVMDEFKIIKD